MARTVDMRLEPYRPYRRLMRCPGDDESKITSPGSRPWSRLCSCASRTDCRTRLPKKPAGPERAICFGGASRSAAEANRSSGLTHLRVDMLTPRC